MDGYDRETGEIAEAMLIQAERMCSAQTNEIDPALIAAMAEFEPPAKTKEAKITGTANYKYTYAPLEDVIAAYRAVWPKNGIWFSQHPVEGGRGMRLRTIVYHKSGQWIGCDYPIYATRNDAQGFASGITYARRYSLLLLGGNAAEDDDDANVADGKPAEIAGTRSPGTPATVTHTGGGHPARQQAAQSSPDRDEAVKRWKELRAEVDAATTVADLESIDGCSAWVTCTEKIVKIDGKEKAETAMQELRDRIADRKDRIMAQGDYR